MTTMTTRATMKDIETVYAGTRIPEQTWQRLREPETSAVVLIAYDDMRTHMVVCNARISPAQAVSLFADSQPSHVFVVTGARQ